MRILRADRPNFKSNLFKGLPESRNKFLIALIISLAGLTWTLSVPFGGTPDEPTYLEYGIFASQELFGIDAYAGNYQNLTKSSCFAFHIEITANCQTFISGNEKIHLEKAALINYPKPWFYLTSWPAFVFKGELALIACKLATLALSLSLLLVPIFFWRQDSEKLILSLILSITPLALSMIGAFNPNNLEIFSAIGLSLMLFGQPSSPNRRASGKMYWVLLTLIIFLSSTSKPLSGFITAFIIFLYLIEMELRKKSLKTGEISLGPKRPYILLTFFSIAVSIIFSWPSISQAKSIPVGQAAVNDLSTSLNFLIRSYDYAIEHAGIFGWRDLGPAPWMNLIWILFAAYIFQNALVGISSLKRNVAISLLFIIFIVAPWLQSILLAHQYNVGFQTRYLSGLFGAISIFTIMQGNSRKVTHLQLLIRAWTFMALGNAFWLFIRHSVGITPALTILPKKILNQFLLGEAWLPTFWTIILVAITTLFWLNRSNQIK